MVLLAAGSGSRFGADKRRHVIAGTPLLITTAQRYASVFAHVSVVLRPREEDLAQALREALPHQQLEVTYAGDAHLGMGHSLAAGVSACSHWPWLFVALADMPFVRTQTLNLLRDQFPRADIVIPTFAGRDGHPVGFAQRFFTALTKLSGDAGARRVIEANRDRVTRVETEDAGVIRDVDRPSDVDSNEELPRD